MWDTVASILLQYPPGILIHCSLMLFPCRPLPFHPGQHLILCNSWPLSSLYCRFNHANLSQVQKGKSKGKTSSLCPISEELSMANRLIISPLKQFRYESQLQMVQVTGSLDNEYFYIDFREYEYDLKWEFPRENLEFGKNQVFQMLLSRFLLVGKSSTCTHSPCVLQGRSWDRVLLGKWWMQPPMESVRQGSQSRSQSKCWKVWLRRSIATETHKEGKWRLPPPLFHRCYGYCLPSFKAKKGARWGGCQLSHEYKIQVVNTKRHLFVLFSLCLGFFSLNICGYHCYRQLCVLHFDTDSG